MYLKRKLNRLTNYTKRLKLLKSGKTRLVFRYTNRNLITQLINYSRFGDNIIFGINSKIFKVKNSNNRVYSLALGELIGVYIQNNLKDKCILDIGYRNFRNLKIISFLKGLTSRTNKLHIRDMELSVDYKKYITPSVKNSLSKFKFKCIT
jgi:large subunit ribosomal protein L18